MTGGSSEPKTVYCCSEHGRPFPCAGAHTTEGGRPVVVEVVPVSALTTAKEQVEAAEKEAERFREIASRYNEGWEKRCDQAESERDTALERVGELEADVELRREYGEQLWNRVQLLERERAALDTDEGER